MPAIPPLEGLKVSIPEGASALIGFATLPAALAWVDARLDGARGTTVIRAMIEAYQPSLATVVLVALWLLGFRVTFGGFTLGLSDLYLPVAAWIAMRFGAAGLPLFMWGMAPLLVGLDFGNVGTRLDPGLFIACVLVHRLVAEPDFRARLGSLQQLGLGELIVIILVGGVSATLSIPIEMPAGSVRATIGGDLGFLLGFVMVALGVAGAPRLTIVGALAVAAAVTAATTLIGHRVEGPDWADLDYRVNPISLYLLFEIGRQWMIALSKPMKSSPHLKEILGRMPEAFSVTLRTLIPTSRNRAAYVAYYERASALPVAFTLALSGLIVVVVAQRALGFRDDAPGAAALFVYFVVLGRIYFDRRIAVALLYISLGAAFVFAAFSIFGSRLSPSPTAYVNSFVSLLILALGAGWLGWRLARWTVAAGDDWRRQYGLPTAIRVTSPPLAPEQRVQSEQPPPISPADLSSAQPPPMAPADLSSAQPPPMAPADLSSAQAPVPLLLGADARMLIDRFIRDEASLLAVTGPDDSAIDDVDPYLRRRAENNRTFRLVSVDLPPPGMGSGRTWRMAWKIMSAAGVQAEASPPPDDSAQSLSRLCDWLMFNLSRVDIRVILVLRGPTGPEIDTSVRDFASFMLERIARENQWLGS
jgi:hypothetical protein